MLFSHNSFVKSQQISAFKMSSPSSSNETSCNKLSIKYILNPIDECSADKKIKFLFTSESYKTPSRKNKYQKKENDLPKRKIFNRKKFYKIIPKSPYVKINYDEYGNYYINGVYHLTNLPKIDSDLM